MCCEDDSLAGDKGMGDDDRGEAGEVKDDDIKNGIQSIELKGRLQEIKKGKLKDIAGNNRLVIDGATIYQDHFQLQT